MDKKTKGDLDTNDRINMTEHLDAQSDAMGLCSYENNQIGIADDADIYGICKGCKAFRYVRYEFHGQRAECNTFDKQLSGRQRIVECVSFDEKGKLSLEQMSDIAWILDFSTKKVGFVGSK